MTPKEKALELYDKFYYVEDEEGFYSMNVYRAKQCAFICADNTEMSCYYFDYKLKKQSHETFNLTDVLFATYWQEVKRAIKKL